VEQDLRSVYKGAVFYANDAFDGLKYMEKIGAGDFGYEPGGAGADDMEALTGTEAKIALAEREDPRYAAGPGGHGAPRTRSAVRTDVPIPTAPFLGTRVVEAVPLDEVFGFVNEVALIRGQWQVRKGKQTEEQYRELLREKVYPDLNRLKDDVKKNGWLQPKVVYGYFPCQSQGDDLIVYEPGTPKERTRFTFPRQRDDRQLCLADYFASVESGTMDVVGFQLVTMGKRAGEHSAKLFAADNYRDYLYFHGLSVESAEALAELWHKRMRGELGIAGKDAADVKRLFSQGYQGSRYSFGYPACPNLEDQTKLMDLLDGERIGVRLTDEFALDPEQSTNAIVVHHPEARYFNVK
jgi:5-methyltetrahydrofolate--homocysteine methyltransferase